MSAISMRVSTYKRADTLRRLKGLFCCRAGGVTDVGRPSRYGCYLVVTPIGRHVLGKTRKEDFI